MLVLVKSFSNWNSELRSLGVGHCWDPAACRNIFKTKLQGVGKVNGCIPCLHIGDNAGDTLW